MRAEQSRVSGIFNRGNVQKKPSALPIVKVKTLEEQKADLLNKVTTFDNECKNLRQNSLQFISKPDLDTKSFKELQKRLTEVQNKSNIFKEDLNKAESVDGFQNRLNDLTNDFNVVKADLDKLTKPLKE